MKQLSQRDPNWANIQLGTSNVTIGSHGCTITSLASIIGTTPDVVNERLKQVGGYANGNLVIWAKISEAFPGIKVRREWSYNNDDVKNNLPAVIQVDGTPIGAPTHFVVYIGDQKLMDPWDGQIKPTSTYNALSYAVVSGKWVQESNYLDQLQMQIEATNHCQTQLRHALEQAESLQKQADSYNSQLSESKIQNEEYRKKYENERRTVLDLKREIEEIHKQDRNFGQEALDAQHELHDAKKGLLKMAEELEVQYDPSSDKKLVEEVLQKVIELKRQQQVPQVDTQLSPILNQLVSMGINSYLEKKNLEPIDPEKPDTQVTEKVSFYLTDLTNELLAGSTQIPVSTPVTNAIKEPRKNILGIIVGPFVSLFFTSK